MKVKDHRLSQLLLGMALLLAGLVLAYLGTFEVWGLKALDWQRRLVAAPAQASENILLIEVDQYSLDRMQADQGIGWPWPREFYGGMAAYVAAGGARATLIDVLFNNETPYGRDGDQAFAKQLAKAGNAFLAAALTNAHSRGAERLPLSIEGESPLSASRSGVSAPLPLLLDAAAGMGAVNSTPDPDGTFRRVDPVLAVGRHGLPLLGLAPIISGNDLQAIWHKGRLTVGGRAVPLDGDGKMWVNFSPQPQRLRYSAYDVIRSMALQQAGESPTISPQVFEDAYVLIGYSAPGLYDLKPTPFAPRGSGMEIHAAVLNDWLTGDFLVPLDGLPSFVLGVLFALLVYGVFQLQIKVSRTIIYIGALLVASLLLSLWLVRLGYLPEVPALFLPEVLVGLGIGTRRFLAESREKEFRQKSLERMVSPTIANWLLADPVTRMRRTGELREISVFFSDLAGFTTLAEELGPEKTVRIINQYMDMMQEVILRNEGTIKQFVGDAVMAIWGAPMTQADQAVLAIRTALESQQALERYEFEYEPGCRLHLSMRIGIDYGNCVVGNIGSSRRFEYAAVGDTVNRASRLEGLNKYYGTRVIVSESAWEASNNAFFGRKLDEVQVKGKQHSVGVYEPLAIQGAETERQKQLVERYQQAWSEYARGRFQAAREQLQGLVEQFDDAPSRALINRITRVESDPELIGDNWKGVWRFQTK